MVEAGDAEGEVVVGVVIEVEAEVEEEVVGEDREGEGFDDCCLGRKSRHF